MAEFPTKAKVVIIGLGGIVGASIAHHLIERGWDELHEQQAKGRKTFLDAYAGESPAEFFAVACEAYFVNRAAFGQHFPALLTLFDAFFRPAR